MKYPQLVSTRAVSTISDWLITRLETLGVEAPIVYSRLLLSLLHTPLQVNSFDLAEIPQLKNFLGKRFNSRRLTQSDAERLKRFAAIESLMEVVEPNQKRSRIVDLVSELCTKLRDLERSEELSDRRGGEEGQEEELQVEEAQGGARNKEVAPKVSGESKKRSGESGKSNPYYQMFPALSGNIPPSSNSSRGTSLSTTSTGGGGFVAVESNWGQQQGQSQQSNSAKWKSEAHEIMNSPTQELFTGGGDKGNNKKNNKNKKRRTNGPGGDKKVFATSSPSNLKMKSHTAGNNNNNSNTHPNNNPREKSLCTGSDKNDPTEMLQQQYHHLKQRHNQRNALNGKYAVEWDTNFSGQWEMEERDPIKEFLNEQRVHVSSDDCDESMNGSVQLHAMDDDVYDNVFKMKRSDVNEEQTMIIKSFLKKKATANGNEEGDEDGQTPMGMMRMLQQPKKADFGFNFESEDYFNLISPIEGGGDLRGSPPGGGGEENRRRLFEREVSSESLMAVSNCGTASAGEVNEERATEFDAKLDAFKAKFDTNIRNLWSQQPEEVVVNEEQQPMSVNSFWQNYNKHLYEYQENCSTNVVGQEEDANNNNITKEMASWPGAMGPPQALMMTMAAAPSGAASLEENFNQNTFQQQTRQAAAAIWSNDLNEYEEDAVARNCLQQYNEHMTAAYQKQMAFNNENMSFAGGPMEQLGLFAKCGQWPTAEASSSSNMIGAGGGFDVNNGELEQLYYSSFPPSSGCDYNNLSLASSSASSMAPVALPESNFDLKHGDNVEVANLKLEQSIAMINHSDQSSFAKVDRNAMGLLKGRRGGGAGGSITNLSSLYGSFKQNSMENLLTSERTHFRPIKQAYVDGHTFDIACSPDTIEYVRSESGSMFFELDKYMEYNVEPSQDEFDDAQHSSSTNVPITRCGTFDHEVRGDRAKMYDNDDDVKPPVSKRSKEADQLESAASENKFTLKFCVRQQNEKCCQTEVIDYEQMRRIENSNSLLVMGRIKYPKYVLPKACTLIQMDEAVAHEFLEDRWSYAAATNTTTNSSNLSMLWENSGSNSLDSSSLNNYESLPANRLLRDELSADAEEILKDSLTYMQNLYIDDMDGEEEEEDEGDVVVKSVENLANYYEMGQLISEILNPGTVKKIAQAFGGEAAEVVVAADEEEDGKGGSNDILWYKNWSQKNWLPILDQDAVANMWKARNVWHYGNAGTEKSNANSGWGEEEKKDNNNNDEEQEADQASLIYGTGGGGEKAVVLNATDEWKFSNLRMLWNDTQMMNDNLEGLIKRKGGEGLVLSEDEEEEKNYHLIIFEKKDPLVNKGRKRRHSASQNLYDDDIGEDVRWCQCDCGKRSEKILRYRNKLLMKRVDKMGYVHNASLLLKNFSHQFDSIDEILNEGLICNAGGGGFGEVCEAYEGEYCGGGADNNFEQVALLRNPNMFLNRTALISMARPLTR